MAGVVKVFVESNNGSLIERKAGQVQRVVLRQLQREEDLSISASPDVADNEQLAKVEMSFGGFPKSVERKTLDSDLLYFEFPFGPKEVTYGDHALQYQEIKRPGLKPLLRARAPKNRTLTLTAIIADRRTRGLGSCEDQLQKLKDMAEADFDLEFRHGFVTFPARLRITRLGITSRERTVNGEITKAQVTLSLKEVLPLNIDIVTLAAITEEPKKIAVVPGDEEEKEKEVPNAQEAQSGEDWLDPDHDPTTVDVQYYIQKRSDMNTADFALLQRYM